MQASEAMRDGSLLVAAVEELFAAVISDVLDAAGYRNQAMRAGLRPLDERLVLCGQLTRRRIILLLN